MFYDDRATSCNCRVVNFRFYSLLGGQSHDDVLAVFGHVQKLAAILVNMGYLKMTVQCRMTSHDNVRRRGSSYDICEMVVRRRRTTSSRIVRHRRGRTTIARFEFIRQC